MIRRETLTAHAARGGPTPRGPEDGGGPKRLTLDGAVLSFRSLRIFSHVELAVFVALLVVAIGHLSEAATTVLGWTHGLGWIALCMAVYAGCRRGALPWPLLAATVFVTGPLGSSIGVEVLRRRGYS